MASATMVIVGAGKMGRAMLDGWLHAGFEPARFGVIDPALSARDLPPGVELLASLAEIGSIASPVDLLVAVKPDGVRAVLASLPPGRVRYIFSVAAGLKVEQLSAALERSPQAVPVRVMPNLPVAFNEGLMAWAARAEQRVEAASACEEWLSPLGRVFELPREGDFAAYTALAGSAPAFVAVIAEALADAAVREGLARPMARELAAGVLRGTARMLQDEVKSSPAELKDSVCSPGGTTIAGVLELEKAGLRAALADAIEASARRARELEGD